MREIKLLNQDGVVLVSSRVVAEDFGKELASVGNDFEAFYIKVNELKLKCKSVKDLEELRKAIKNFPCNFSHQALISLDDSIGLFMVWLLTSSKRDENVKSLYLVKFSDNTIKIGVSRKPQKRIKVVAKQAGRIITDTEVFNFSDENGATQIELAFKEKFRSSLINGEIFEENFEQAKDWIESQMKFLD